MELTTLWQGLRSEVRRQVGEQVWTSWFGEASVRSFEGDRLELGAPTALAALFVEKNFGPLLNECAAGLVGRPVEVHVVHAPAAAPVPQAAAAAPDLGGFQQLSLFDAPAPATPAEVKTAPEAPPSRAAILQRAMDCRLNAQQTFESFVVGASNEFAVAAARAVAENPSIRYNPLFIYSPPGLGKTHLLHAIGLAALERNPRLRVRYVKGETFVNEFIEAVRHEDMRDFRQRNRAEVDVLLVDDIQFLEAKERTQVEFFHTFNDLFESGRQVVITSDRTPGDLRALDERLRSRCAQGLVVDVSPPDLETRIAILKRRAASHKVPVPNDVLVYIAEQVKTNVRELHGALLRIGARAQFSRVPVTLEIAREDLSRVVAEAPSARVTPEVALQVVCAAYNVTPKDMKGRKRIAKFATPRKVAMYLARRHTGCSYPELAEFFGGRDHTTILAAVRSVEASMEARDELSVRVEQLERKLTGR